MSNNTDTSKAIELVRKVLAKAENNTNEHEKEVASMKAQEILAKYGLQMKDVRVEEEKKEVANEQVIDKFNWWIGNLGHVIADNFRCSMVRYTTYRGKNDSLHFIGLKDDVEIASEVFLFMQQSIEYFSKAYVVNMCNKLNNTPMKERIPRYQKFLTLRDLSGVKNDYITGFIDGLRDKFNEQVKKNDWGLVLQKDDAVVSYVKNMHLTKGRRSSVKSSWDATHYKNGHKQGKSTSYSSGLITE